VVTIVPPAAILSYSIYPCRVLVIGMILTIHRTVSETSGTEFLCVIYTKTRLQMRLVSGG